MKNSILVIGSSNIDLIAKVERFPSAGETVTGNYFLQAMGGKGANQAVAAKRCGGNVVFITSLGNDVNGRNALDYYAKEGMNVSGVRLVENVPTGTAMILVNKEGENVIVVTPGANQELSAEYVTSLSAQIADADLLMLQMEIPLATVKRACELAKHHSTPVLLNVAPAVKIDDELLKAVKYLVVNETEIETITGISVEQEANTAIDALRKRGSQVIILTLGKNGCIVRDGDTTNVLPAYEVVATDSTAAGDTFCGALAARLAEGAALLEAIRFATAAAAICVTRMGAQPSVPTKREVDEFLLAQPHARPKT